MTADFTRLTRPSVLKDLLNRHGFSFKKQYGQNFLIDSHALDKIIDAADIAPTDALFEVGPGAGVVTQALAESASKVVAVEKDRQLGAVLADSLAPFPNVEVVYQDVLDLDLREFFAEKFKDAPRVSMVANLPYYITTPILFHVLESGAPLHRLVVMVQKEVADRMTASPGGKDYGVLSVMVQYRAKVTRAAVVPASAFMPAPNVDSAVVALRCDEVPVLPFRDDKAMLRVVKAAFGMRRKTLLNSLAGGLGWPKDKVRECLAAAQIEEQRRAETLSLEEFSNLAKIYTDYTETDLC